MKLPRKKRDETSATITQTLCLILACSALFALTAFGSPPSWWSSRGAVVAPVVTTNDGVVTTNYVPNDYAAVTQGQLKQFTARAVNELNADLPNDGGAGTNLNSMVSNWAQDYATNGYNASNIKPSDYTAMNVGQLKYIGNKVWTQLVAVGYTNAAPSWLQQNTNTDHAVANLGQLKSVFNFDLATRQLSDGSIPQITSAATATTAVDATFSYAITASNSPTSFSATGLPSGLSVNTTTGVISGTPTASGISSVTLSATNASGTGTGSLVIDVTSSSAVPVINSATTATATAGSTFAYQITASHSATQFGASNLPSGFTVDPVSGAISGTVSTAGTYSIDLSASNGSGTGTAVLTLTVDSNAGTSGGTAPVITSSTSTTAVEGESFSYSIVASGTPTSYAAVGLPSGLSLDATTGVITGTPTVDGNFSVVISAVNSAGTASVLLNLTISGITSPPTAIAAIGAAFSYTITTSLVSPTFGASNLPDGLSLDATTGVISGTPTQAGTSTVTLQATSSGTTVTANLTLTVDAVATSNPVIISEATDTAIAGNFYNYTIVADNAPTSFTATLSGGGSLPAGLTLDATNGTISGTPTTAGTDTIALTATNAQGSGTATLTLTVDPLGTGLAPIITSPTLDYAIAGSAYSYATTVSNSAASFSATGLPTGFAINSTTGVISGTPTQDQVGSPTITISATNSVGTTTMALLLVIQSGNSTATATMVLQAGVSPSSDYETSSVGIAIDTAHSTLADKSSDVLMVGRLTSTQTNRALLGFDLSVLPPGATITSASLILNAEATSSSSSTTTYGVELHAATGSLSHLADLQSANWTNDNGYNSTVLSTLTTTLPTTATQETWSSSSNFVSAAQDALGQGSPLFLMLVSPTIESGTTADYFIFDNEAVLYTPPTASTRPALSLTYTTSAPPVIAGSSPISTTPGSTFSYQIPTTNGAASYSATGLPDGLSIDTTTGIISGTPTQSGTFTITIGATNGNGTSTSTLTLNIGSAPAITSALTASATVNSSFSYTITASGTSYTTPIYMATNLPVGLTIDPATGIISGTPTVGSDPVTVTLGVTTLYGTATANLVITFVPVINGPLAASGNLTIPFSYSIPANYDATSFSITGTTSLSALGLSLNSSNGMITGTPTATGTYSFTVTAINSAGTSPSATLTITIAGAPVLTLGNDSASGTVEYYFYYFSSYYLPATYNPPLGSATVYPGGYNTFTYAIASGSSLPEGLAIYSSGEIYGTPTVATTGTDAVGVTVTDSFGNTATGTLNLLINSGPGFQSSLSDQAEVNSPYWYYLRTITRNETSTAVTNLPPGLSYDSSTEAIWGTPTTPGTYSIGLSATNATGMNTATLTLVVQGLTSASTASAVVGQPFAFQVSAYGTVTSFSAPNLPVGLSIDPNTGIISGTPVAANVVPVTLDVTTSTYPYSGTLWLTITANPSDSAIQFQQGVSPTVTYTAPSNTVADDVPQDAENPNQATNQRNQTFNTGTVLPVGLVTATKMERGLLSFDLSALPSNVTITSANLVLNASSSNSSGAPMPVEIHQSVASFEPATATWSNNSSYQGTTLASATLDPSTVTGANIFAGTAAFTQAVQQAYNKAVPVNLVLASPTAEGSVSQSSPTPDYIGFATRATDPTQNPKLVVTYSYATSTVPVITSPTVATGTVGTSFSYPITATGNPTSYLTSTLPAWLSLNSSTGLVSGTPTQVGSSPVTVSASNANGTGSQAVTINIDSATPATSLTAISGNNQVGVPGTFLAEPLMVQACASGTTLPNALVTFTVPRGEGAFGATNSGTPTPSNTLTVVTNGSGDATVYFFLPQSLGTTTIIASAGTAAPVSLVETSALNASGANDSLVLLSVISGEGQSGPAGQTLPQPFVVQATNASGQPVTSQGLSLTVVEGGGGISSTSGGSFGSTLSISTDGSGQATIYLQPGGSNGTANKVSCVASVSGEQTTVVYLTALTSSTSGSSLTPGGGTPPSVDQDPQAWNGYAYIVEADEDNGNSPVNGYPDPTQIDIHWSPTTGPDITGFLIEKKVSTGQWFELTTENTGGNGYYLDTGLQANEEVQYRVSPYINGVLGSPCAPVGYQVPLLQSIDEEPFGLVATKPGFEQFNPPPYPIPPLYYLTCTSTGWMSSGASSDSSSSGAQDTYNSTQTLVPTPDPQQDTLDINSIYGGSFQSSSWGTSPDYWYFNSASATQNTLTGAWIGSWQDNNTSSSTSGTNPTVDGASFNPANLTSSTPTTETFSYNQSSTNNNNTMTSWESVGSIWTLSDEETTPVFITSADASVANLTPPFAWENTSASFEGGPEVDGLWMADRYIALTQDYYVMEAAQYRLWAYPAKDMTFQWAEIFLADDPTNSLTQAQRTKVVRINNWTFNSSAQSVSDPFTIDPRQYNQYGVYSIVTLPQLNVFAGGATLDSQQMTQVGAPVSQVTVPAGGTLTSSSNLSGAGSFTISGGQISGTIDVLSWTGDSTLQVWSLNDSTGTWQQMTSGQQVVAGLNSQFAVIATAQAQANDYITLALTSFGPDGTQLETDSSKFYYSKPPPDLSIPIDEASGSRYRKIALNGLPMSDEKPQQSAESDQEKEETYIDALTLGLRHSTTDVYMPVSGSDFSVSARRDFRSQVWNARSGLRPHEQPDLPFGMCWSSNLAPNIKLVTDNDPNKTQPDQAVVTDETGAVHTFFIWYDSTNNNAIKFFPMPTAKNEAQVPNLETLTENTTTTPATYTFSRKYGATLTYQNTTLSQTISNDRTLGSSYETTYQYARLVQATDRVGNVVNYQFQGTTNLVPATITVANQPGIELFIEQEPISSFSHLNISSPQSVVTAIWDANGNKTCYHYCAAPGDPTAVVLDKVITPDGHTTNYTYSAQSEPDKTPHALSDPGNTYWYADIASITDPLGHAYQFSYALDHSKLNYMDNPAIDIGYYVQSGCPRNVTQVTMPDSTTATFVNTNNASPICLKNNTSGTGLIVSGPRISQVTDATGFTRTYTFDNSQVVPLPRLPDPIAATVASKVIVYQDLSIAYGNLGAETFQFDITAAMALKQITDFSGNTTTFAHANPWTAPADYRAIMVNTTVNGFYDDPTSQTDALGHPKTFTYFGADRIMQSSTDENGNKTYYDIDSLGRRTTEKLYDSGGALVQETDFTYGSSAYPGFMTTKCVKALTGSGPSWVKALVTQYAPDANGRVAQETVDPGGLNLVTTYSYDANGNKLTATDPKGHTTWFSYDTRNRLVTITYADGSQKQIQYDARGNKTIEYDENGIATLYAYDSLNRLVTQARNMDGTGVLNSSTDLITSYTYNAVNSKLSTTSPIGGVTSMVYDSLQRVTQITDALSHATLFAYGANSGGNVFDSSSFKPTHTCDPRGFATDITYDALYRPLTKAAQYAASTPPSTTSTQYDNVGNARLVTDPLGNQTAVAYDALNRPVLTTYADGSTTQESYTSTGFKWQVIDPNGNVAQTQYDNAGRAISVTQGYGTSAAATTATAYDDAGNVAETINPLGNKWDYAYDARDHKLQEFEPAVLDMDPSSPHYNTMQRPTLSWQYDPAGRVVAAIDARANDSSSKYETDTYYDPANRVIKVCQPSVAVSGGSPAHPITHSTYDKNGNVLTLTDPDSHTTTNTYDLLNRLLTTTDAAGIVVTNTYDQVGNKLTVEDGNNDTTTFAYDGLDRLLTTTDAAGKSTGLRYDAMNKTQRIDALGQATTYLYDARNRLSNVVYASGAAANSQRNYAYDNVGNLLSVTEPSKTVANVVYVYDPLNRVTSETSQGKTHTYAYDAAGNRLSTVYGGTGRTITSTYDYLNRLLTMQEQTPAEITASSPGRTTSYAYDLNGNITQKTAPNGDTEAYSFDALNRATVESAQTGGAVSLFDYEYGYDLAGNVTSVNETYPSGLGDRLVTNTYDTINRLTVEAVTASASNATTTYAYDNANNRTSKAVTGTGADSISYSYNNLNQLTSYGDGTRSVALSYDFNGNRTARVVTGSSDAGTDTYSYDFENRLIGLVKGTSGGAGTYVYQYDYRTRRIVRDETNAGGVITALVFSGGTSVQEYNGTTPTLAVEYLRGSDYGGGVGGILYTVRGGHERYTHANRRGDIVAKTDSTGFLKYQAQYEAFGNQVATSGSTEDRQKSNSKDTDPTNLVDEGFRYRDLETGMFISRDPAGFIDGPNLYTYVRQNPWTAWDPEGLTGTDRVEGYAQGVTNGLIGTLNFLKNVSPVTALIPNIPEVHNEGSATDKNDFISGENGGSVFFAGGSAVVGGVGGLAAKGPVLAKTGEEFAEEVSTAAPKPEPTAPPGAKPADESAPAPPDNAPDPGKCFIAGTLVSTPHGEVPIETIKAGDVVWSLDLKSSHIVQKQVKSIFSHFTEYWVDVTAGGEKITATRGHRFWVESLKRWVPAMELKPGMKLLSSSGRIVAITEVHVRHLPTDETTYNFFVADTHVYFVGQHGWLVHNGDNDDAQRKSVADMSKEERVQHYTDKGVPKSQLGPSGRPKVHIVETSTDKEAEEAARNAGQGKPIKHAANDTQPEHYHAVDADGNKLEGAKNIHYQKRGGC